eukprot:COSAG05_NODE_203_length_14207_cov_24.645379_7_plen_63_part_00
MICIRDGVASVWCGVCVVCVCLRACVWCSSEPPAAATVAAAPAAAATAAFAAAAAFALQAEK